MSKLYLFIFVHAEEKIKLFAHGYIRHNIQYEQSCARPSNLQNVQRIFATMYPWLRIRHRERKAPTGVTNNGSLKSSSHLGVCARLC